VANASDEQGDAPAGGDGGAASHPSEETTRPATEAETVPSPAAEISRGRRIFVRVLIGVTTLLLILAMFSIYANRLLLNPDNWSTTSTRLLQSSNVRSATAAYLTDQLYSNVDVPQVLASALPPQLKKLASPAAGALRSGVQQSINLALTRPAVQTLWEKANRAADQTLVDIVNGKKGTVTVNQGAVTLNLGQLLDNMASRLGISANVTSKLPANVATLTLFKSNQLKFIQNVGNAIKGLALALTIAVPLLYAAAIALARGRRRRTLRAVGFACIFAGVLVFFGRSIMETQVASALTKDAALHTTISDVVAIATEILVTVAGAVVFTGLLLVAAAFIAGPTRFARTVREGLAPSLRERPVASYAVTLGLLVLLFIWDPIPATGTPAGIITFSALGLFGTFLLRRQTEREFPDARPGEATERMRRRWQEMRGGRAEPTPRPVESEPTQAEQLQQLANLRGNGAITAGEYEAAKGRLLGV
jgi:hypothetical protein